MASFPSNAINLIALTPALDGIIEEGEWDQPQFKTCSVQWEPGTLYLSFRAPVNESTKIVVDQSTYTVSFHEGAPLVMSDVEESERFVRVAAQEREGIATVEMAILSPSGKGFQLRDFVNLNFQDESHTLLLLLERGSNIPSSMSWSVDAKYRTVVPGESIDFKFLMNLDPADAPKRINIASGGRAAAFTSTQNNPFPRLDQGGNCSMEFEFAVAEGASEGYRVLRAQLEGESTTTPQLEASYQIAELATLKPTVKGVFFDKDKGYEVRAELLIQSNTRLGIKGDLSFGLPEGWTMKGRPNRRIILYHGRGSSRQPVVFIAPPSSKGLVIIPVLFEVGNKILREQIVIRLPEP